MSTKDIIAKHLESFGRRDLDALLSDYRADSILFTPAGPLKGLGEIQPFFEALFAEFARPDSSFELEHLSVEGEYGYIVWHGKTAEQLYDLATDTFFVSGGKIRVQSFAGKILPRH